MTNLSGGIKAWKGNVAVGDQTAGLHLFSGEESVGEILVVAYSLEKGLEDFYSVMAERVTNTKTKKLFQQLSRIETVHRENILEQYQKLSGLEIDHESFEDKLLPNAIEGGLSTEEYIDLFSSDLDETTSVIGLAMTIETQALDLYDRAGHNTDNKAVQAALWQIASEEKSHLKLLGHLLDDIL